MLPTAFFGTWKEFRTFSFVA